MDNPQYLPVTPLRDSPVFPHTETVLVFGRNKSVNALQAAWEKDKLILVVMQKGSVKGEPTPNDIYNFGTICQVKHIFQTEGEVSALVAGLSRAKVTGYQVLDGFMVASVETVPDISGDLNEASALSGHILSNLQSAVRLGKSFDFLILMKIMAGLPPLELSDQMVSLLDLKPEDKEFLLEEPRVNVRLIKIVEHLENEMKVLEVERKITGSVQNKMEKTMRENILRERKRAIEEELGEDDDDTKDIKELKAKMAKIGFPPETKDKIDKEIQRLSRMSPMNPEHGYVRTYLDWVLSMPWSEESPNNADIAAAEDILNADHFGLERVKERVIEYLAVLKLKHQQESSKSIPTILCFVGPPGVGKTSIGKSIAKALGRKFARVSLGGVRDEAEIRGHRRTYVGSLPGRIIQGIKQAGTKNPVFMLDEIDKIGNDFRGDPSASLLEALDPEQNSNFSDHYLEIPFDLSEVIFITTANLTDTIPMALLDRMEIIPFPGYTSTEKFQIGKKYLIPKQIEINGLKSDQVKISDPALRIMIARYTHEAGVRNLEREIARIFRKIAKKIAQHKLNKKALVGPSNLHRFLGPFKFTSTVAERENEVGLATGLAVSQAGGGILLVEVATMPGKGIFSITGRLGDVMQESARAAMSYVRSHWKQLGLEEKFFQKIDVHIHVPEGSIPKDGPSAGIAITAALASALSKVPVNRYVGMTGEVTLRGRVLEIGGVKEKVIGAHLAGMKTVILPKANKKDLEEIPQYVQKDLQFKFVDHMDEVLDLALIRPK